MRRLITLLFFIGFGTSLLAGPAEPVVMEYTQPNGTVVHYYLHGDEHLNWMTDLSGSVIEIGSDGYVRPGTMPSEAAFRSARGIRAENNARPFRIQSSGTRRIIVVLVDYPDLAFSKTAESFNQFFNGNGAGSTGSVSDYFQDQSDGKFSPVFDIYGPVTLSNNRASYKDSPKTALGEAIGILVNDGTLNLNDYISSSSGIFKYVDDVIMIFAGHSQASGDPDGIWPCSQSASVYKVNDRLSVYGYCCGPELQGASGDSMAGIGHICHEFGHRMGLPDFYDTKRSEHGDNVAEGCLDFSLMGHGSYNNYSKTPPPLSMVEKSICGWAQLESIPSITSSQSITLHEIGQGADKTRACSIPTDKEGEVFICEYRSKNASVNKWSNGLPRGGMIVYHMDRSDREITQDGTTHTAADWWGEGKINNNGSHPLFYLIPSGDQSNLKNSNQDLFPFPGSSNILTYNPVSWNNTASFVSLAGISYNSGNTSMTLKAHVRPFPLINNPRQGVYNAGSFTLKLSPGSEGNATVSSWYLDGTLVESTEPRPRITLTAGTHVIEAVLSTGKKLRLDLTAQ